MRMKVRLGNSEWVISAEWQSSLEAENAEMRLGLKVKVTQLCPTFCNPMDYTVHGILQARILEWVDFPCSRGSSQPRDGTRVPTLQVDSLPTETQGKPKNAGVGGLSVLQQIFMTQDWKQGLLHCRWILYQLSHKGSLRLGLWRLKYNEDGSSAQSQI